MPTGQVERLWLLGGAVAALLMVLIGYLFFISPQRGQTSSKGSELASVQQSNAVLQTHLIALRQQNKNLAQYRATLMQEQLELPDTSGLPDFLRTLQSLGDATLANVSSLTVGSPTDVTQVAGAPSTTTAAQPGGLSVFALPITAQVTGTAVQLDQFLTQLQSVQPRAVLISQITEGSANTSTGARISGTTLQLTMQAFVAPSSASEQAALSAASH